MSALKIIELRSENVLHLNLDEFKQITTKDDLADRSLVIVSIAGAMRKGKSLLLNFFLTYAYNKYRTTETTNQPKTFENGSLIDGFSHCGGTDRHTTGIQIWRDIFLHDYPDGKKVAIIFMDTQGTFDYETKFSDCVSIFALSTLLSSVQIYNINYNIQNDHLQYLALFVEYAKLAMSKITFTNTDDTPPFDKLQILVRDWNFRDDADYGLAGGKKILEKTFSSTNAEVKKIILSIKDRFETIECFLMPFPGNTIATTPRFDGNTDNVDKTFLEQVALLTDHLLNPESLQIKKFNGVELKVSNFINVIEQGFNILSKYENIPKPKTIMAATVETQSHKLVDDAVNLYKKLMNDHLAKEKYFENEAFMKLHNKYSQESMNFYENADKLETFDSETDERWKMHLDNLLTREYNFFLILNEKNKPDTPKALQNLIKIVAEQNDIIKELNEKHAQDMLDLINTFRKHEHEHKEHLKELVRNFEESPSSGFSFMNVLMKVVEIVPTTIRTLGLDKTPLGKLAVFGTDLGRSILGASNNH